MRVLRSSLKVDEKENIFAVCPVCGEKVVIGYRTFTSYELNETFDSCPHFLYHIFVLPIPRGYAFFKEGEDGSLR